MKKEVLKREDFRKVMITGKDTSVITLPKKWIERNKIKKGDILKIKDIGKSLILTSYKELEDEENLLTARITYDGDETLLLTSVIGAYVLGIDELRIIGTTEFDPGLIIKISKICSSLEGLEIFEERKDFIFIKNILSPDKLSFRHLLSRMATLSKLMFWNFFEGISQNPKLLNTLIDRDEELNRLYLLGVRLLHLSLMNPKLSLKLGFESSVLVIGRLLILRNIEKLIDELKNLVILYNKIENIDTQIIEIFDALYSIYSDLIDQFVKFETEKSIGDISKRINQLDDILNSLPELMKEFEKKAINYHYILSIRVLCEKLKNIASIMINYLFYWQNKDTLDIGTIL